MTCLRLLNWISLIFLVMCGFLNSVDAQETTRDASGDVYYWYDGETRIEVHRRKDLVAEFTSGASPSSANVNAGAQKLSPQIVKQDGKTRILKVTSSSGGTSGKLTTDQSPVFSDAPTGGQLRTLPGGIVVTFAEKKSEGDVRLWAEQNGLSFDRILPVSNSTVATFKTAPGLISLEEANRVRTLVGVASAEPNWWAEKWKGSEIVGPPVPSAKTVASRKSASDRFSDENLDTTSARLRALLRSHWNDRRLQTDETAIAIVQEFHPELLPAITRWKHEKRGVATPSTRIKNFRCTTDPRLYPINENQQSKLYHAMISATPQAKLVSPDSMACRSKSQGEKAVCREADQIRIYIVSDLYKDACGNAYRGLDVRIFPAGQEKMDSLVSLGHTLTPKPNEPGVFIESSHPVEANAFELLVEP